MLHERVEFTRLTLRKNLSSCVCNAHTGAKLSHLPMAPLKLGRDTPSHPLTLEHVESFLAEHTIKQLSDLAGNQDIQLERYILERYALPRDERMLMPDTQEANEAATVDALRSQRAEERVTELMEREPQAWAALKRVIPSISRT
jgi:hypothetical protein